MINKVNISLSFILILLSLSCASQDFTLYGIIHDSISGESLAGVSIRIAGKNNWAISNEYGFYSLTLPQGRYVLFYSFIGFETSEIQTDLVADKQMDISLHPKSYEISEVSVKAETNSSFNSFTGANRIDISRMKEIPTATGEADVLQSLQLLPGIQTSNEGSVSLNIRGGSHDQNLIILDEAPVYNSSHSLGFFSAFNSDAIKDVVVYKGIYPAEFGDKLSSVVDISMKEGNNKKFTLNTRTGILVSSVCLEGPIIKDKASFIISGRYSYTGQILNLVAGKIGHDLLNVYGLRDFTDNNIINFNDLNMKFNFRLNNHNHFYFSSYSGHDDFLCYPLNFENSLNWGNQTGTIRWNHIFHSRIFSNFTIYTSRYNYAYHIDTDIRNYDWKSHLGETGVKADLSAYLSEALKIKSGLFGIRHLIYPGEIVKRDSTSIINSFSLDHKQIYETGIYISISQRITKRLKFSGGLRYSLFFQTGPATEYTFNSEKTMVTDSATFGKTDIFNTSESLEPRLALTFKIDSLSSVKLSYGRTSQYLHLLSNSTVGLPTDTWLPSGNTVMPERSWQISAGFYQSLLSKTIDLSIEIYYRKLDHITDFRDNADLFLNKYIDIQILQGKGKSYGAEWLIEKRGGRLNGWISYTLANTQYFIPGINNGKPFSPRFDIRHNLAITGVYALNRTLKLSSTFKLTSGGFITIPTGVFTYDGASFYYYSSRNGYQLPVYHRLDVSVIYSNLKNKTRNLKTDWTFGFYNVYNRKNVYSLFIQPVGGSLNISNSYNMYLFGIIPSLTFHLKI